MIALEVAHLSGETAVPFSEQREDPPPLEVEASWVAFRARHFAAHGPISDEQLVAHLAALDAIVQQHGSDGGTAR